RTIRAASAFPRDSTLHRPDPQDAFRVRQQGRRKRARRDRGEDQSGAIRAPILRDARSLSSGRALRGPGGAPQDELEYVAQTQTHPEGPPKAASRRMGVRKTYPHAPERA